MPIVLLVFGLVWQKRITLRAQLDQLLDEKRRKLLGCFFASQFLTMKTDSESGILSWCFVLSSEAKAVLNLIPSYLRGDCNTAQWETHLQVRNKEVCFAYQLLATSRVAFGCCHWFCRCMPSCGSMVMRPFPRKLHWNILTVTFVLLLKEFGPVSPHVRINSGRSAA